MKTVHLVFNAHLDPIWLWPWEAGLDEVLNTCETVCGLLERHPDVIFTRGEAWVYEQIRLLNHGLFRRIKRLIRRGNIMFFVFKNKAQLQDAGYEDFLESLGLAFLGACR